MTDNVEMEARRKSHVGFESECFLLLAPPAQRPLYRKRPRQQTDGEAPVFKPARGKIQRGLQTRTAGLPSQIDDAAFSEACRLHPLQHVAGAPPVVTDKPGVPQKTERESCDNVDENETPHGASLGRNRTSNGCNRARGGNGKNFRGWLAATLSLQSRYNGGVPFRIRQFDKADFDTLWRIDQACFDPQLAYSRPEMAFYMRRPGSFTLVAEAEGGELPGNGRAAVPGSSILGFIVAETRRKTGHIITIDVVAGARREGVGSALLRAAEDRLLHAGALAVELETPMNNDAAIRFYKQKGYFVEKTVAGYYANHLDALVMMKELARSPVG
jgi:ribosomal-protein-alanine N-acetyltransferase